jgi:hypothetical protein
MQIQPELKTVLKRLRLSGILATLPDRWAYARQEKLIERHTRSSTILTSDRGIEEWMAVFDDPMLGQSALDRFCHRAHQFVIEGESYRKRTAPGSTPAPKNSRKATT